MAEASISLYPLTRDSGSTLLSKSLNDSFITDQASPKGFEFSQASPTELYDHPDHPLTRDSWEYSNTHSPETAGSTLLSPMRIASKPRRLLLILLTLAIFP